MNSNACRVYSLADKNITNLAVALEALQQVHPLTREDQLSLDKIKNKLAAIKETESSYEKRLFKEALGPMAANCFSI